MILSVPDLAAYATKGVILLDGSFDPLHAGHLQYFQAAASAFPNHLRVVAIASDEDIRAKGREPLLDQLTRATVVDGLKGVDAVVLKDWPTQDLIAVLQPRAYVKGMDWEDALPQEQIDACALHGVQMRFLNTVTDSSTARLRAWALKDADQSLDRLQAVIASQGEVNPDRFDTAYFQGDWRADGNAYTYEKRKQAEGRHPKIVKEVFEGLTVLDVGCGPGYFVRMLREVGMDAGGIDPSPDAVALSNGFADRVVRGDVAQFPSKMTHVAICREVLEHVPVADIPGMVCDLFRVARRFVYVTTRFSTDAVFDCQTSDDLDPTHISMLSQPFLRALCVLNGGTRRRDLESKLDHVKKGRCLVYEVSQ